MEKDSSIQDVKNALEIKRRKLQEKKDELKKEEDIVKAQELTIKEAMRTANPVSRIVSRYLPFGLMELFSLVVCLD